MCSKGGGQFVDNTLWQWKGCPSHFFLIIQGKKFQDSDQINRDESGTFQRSYNKQINRWNKNHDDDFLFFLYSTNYCETIHFLIATQQIEFRFISNNKKKIDTDLPYAEFYNPFSTIDCYFLLRLAMRKDKASYSNTHERTSMLTNTKWLSIEAEIQSRK